MYSKQLLRLFIVILLFAQCKTGENKIRVKGRAENSKAGACVFTNDDQLYFITGMREWPEKYFKKKLVVKGKLSVVYDTATTVGLERQRIRVKKSIDSASYRMSIFGFIKKYEKQEY
jgi:hypothetical protein